jgi:hypothetical protein
MKSNNNFNLVFFKICQSGELNDDSIQDFLNKDLTEIKIEFVDKVTKFIDRYFKLKKRAKLFHFTPSMFQTILKMKNIKKLIIVKMKNFFFFFF